MDKYKEYRTQEKYVKPIEDKDKDNISISRRKKPDTLPSKKHR